jgi:hypothetical protein
MDIWPLSMSRCRDLIANLHCDESQKQIIREYLANGNDHAWAIVLAADKRDKEFGSVVRDSNSVSKGKRVTIRPNGISSVRRKLCGKT